MTVIFRRAFCGFVYKKVYICKILNYSCYKLNGLKKCTDVESFDEINPCTC